MTVNKKVLSSKLCEKDILINEIKLNLLQSKNKSGLSVIGRVIANTLQLKVFL